MSYDPQDTRITAYVFDELSASERAVFEDELRRSEALRAAVQQVRDTLATLADELATETSTALAAERRVRVDAAIDAAAGSVSAVSGATGVSAERRGPSWNTVVRWAVAASLLLVGGFVSGTYWSGRPNASLSEVASLERDARSLSEVLATSADPSDHAAGSLPAVTTNPAEAAPWSASSEGLSSAVRPAGPTTTASGAGARSALAPGAVTSSSRRSEEERASLAASAATVDALSAIRGHALRERRRDVTAGPAREYFRGGPGAMVVEEKLVAKGEFEELRKSEISRQQGGKDLADHGGGPGEGGDKFDPIVENDFREVKVEPLSTFSIDVDTASYSKVRQYLMQHQILPRPDAVRIEELVNYFTYDDQPPRDETPFAAHVEVAACPWTPRHRLVRIGIKGREVERAKRPASNLVFLLDVSGSMNQPNKLPLVKHGMKMLVNELGENDRVAIVVYAGAAGLVLPSTSGDRKQTIVDALEQLQAGGSTNGGEGIRLAYQTALDHFIQGGVNRVILCSDGDFNVGVTGTDELVRLAADNAKTGVFLSVLGFGMGNHNDSMMEQISNKGNGNYAFIDTELEARKVLVEQMSGTLVTIAKDVKIQVEFNPTQVAAFRLIGYENRMLAAQDFNDDKKDAGEIGAGHTVTALYEIVPVGAETNVQVPPVDELKYQRPATVLEAAASGELLTLKLRYKRPDGDKSELLSFPVKDSNHQFGQATRDFRFASAVAAFGMALRNSKYKGELTLGGVLEIATEAAEGDKSGYRAEFLRMVAKAKELRGE